MITYVIFDLDGCFADDRRRQPLIDHSAPDPWEAYHADCENDPLINEHIIEFVRYLYPFCQPVIFTARPEKFRPNTERWLHKVAGIKVRRLFMRPENCHKSSPELKEGFLRELFASGIKPYEISIAFDDREDVLAIYAVHGVPAMKISYPSEVNSHA